VRFFIVNRVSGNGRGLVRWSKVEPVLKKKGIPYRVAFTERPGHATELAREAVKSGVQAVVAVGGDGTVHEVGNGLVETDVPFGYIPAGSGNDFATDQGIPRDPVKALERVLEHRPRRVDTADFGGRVMISSIGVGFDGQVAKVVNNSRWKQLLGKGSYALGVLRELRRFQPTRVVLEVDGKVHREDGVWLIAIANISCYGGGMRICPEARNDDGLLDICLVRGISRLNLLRLFPLVFSGKHVNYPYIVMLRGSQITVSSEAPLVVHADGEIVGETPISVRIRPQSLWVL
jgi:diacylglycerol kinase (ATP)